MAVTQPSESASASPTPSNVDQAEEHNSRSEGSNYIERSTLLDIAFLHSIATHRPIGPHKHFNVIPILINLDRTARQVGARIRDDVYMREITGGEDEDGDGKSSSRRSIKREEDEVSNSNVGEVASQSVPIDSAMVWERLGQLYDVRGLEDLENQAIDNDVYSPFRHVYAYLQRRRLSTSTNLQSLPTATFGFGSGLEKKRKQSTKSSNRSSTKRTAAAAAAADEEEEGKDHGAGGGNDLVEFQLGPWDEFEPLIAPRRLKSFAPDEENQASESDEDLSEPSEAEDGADGEEGEAEAAGNEALSEAEDGDVDNDEEGEEVEEIDEEEIEDEDEEEDEQDTSTTKRKAPSSKKQAASSKKARKATSSSANTAKSKGARKVAKPRRSSRR